MKKLIFLTYIIVSTFIYTTEKNSYKYPYENRYESTILGGSTLMLDYPLPKVKNKEYSIKINPTESIPKNLWYQEGFKFSLAKQKNTAPLIFVIAGTGSSHDSLKMKYLERIFHNKGYHVISISSPMHINFLLNAGTEKVPGLLMPDSQDIYKVMDLAYKKVKNKISVTDFYLTGYSLGASQAAFVSYIDEKEKKFNFKRVFMINPTVDLYSSALIFDEMLKESTNNDKKNIGVLIKEMLLQISKVTSDGDISIDEEKIFSAFKEKKISYEKMQALIALSFRMISIDLSYLSDLISHSGLYSKESDNKKYPDMFSIYEKMNFPSFEEYFENIAVPYYQKKGYSRSDILKKAKINTIEEYLKKSEKIMVVTNDDELILTSKEIKYLETIFKDRFKTYPLGGHCGNMFYTENVEIMLNFLQKGMRKE